MREEEEEEEEEGGVGRSSAEMMRSGVSGSSVEGVGLVVERGMEEERRERLW